MKKILNQQREIVVILVYICIIAILVYLVIFPLLAKINGVRDQIQEESLKQEIIGRRLEELPKMRQQYATLQENEGLIDVLLDKDNAVVLIEKLENMATGTGNNIEISISSTPVKPAQTVKGKNSNENALVNALPSADYLQMKIILYSDYNSAITFIQALENFTYYCDIIGIQIKKNESNAVSVPKTGILNPFGSGSLSSSGQGISDNTKAGELQTSLDVVFYTK